MKYTKVTFQTTLKHPTTPTTTTTIEPNTPTCVPPEVLKHADQTNTKYQILQENMTLQQAQQFNAMK